MAERQYIIPYSRESRKGTPMSIVPIVVLLPLIISTIGCSTHMVSVRYQPTGQIVSNALGEASVTVGSFTDDRGTDSNWLGAIRGGYGNPLKRLRTDKPTNEMVEVAFADALRARNILGTKDNAKVAIEGNITKFDCSYYFNREAHAHLLVKVVVMPSRALIFSSTYKTDKTESGVGAGIFGDTDHLAAFAQRTLNESIDKVFSDPGFIEAILHPSLTPKARSTRSASERLREIEQLKENGLITDSEYEAKRKEILGGI